MAAKDKPPVIGAPPTLEWVALDQLHVDDSYQRSTSSNKSVRVLASMARQWDWRLCQPLAVVRRDDLSLFVIDGQHRLFGARQRGDIPHLPCVITRQTNAEDEAAMFVALNTQRTQLTQGDIFHAAQASGDPQALTVARLVERAGLSFARHSNHASWKPGQIFCGPMLMRSVDMYGESVVSNALVAMAEAHKGQTLNVAATVLKALFVIYRDDAKQVGFDPDLFIAALGSVAHADWPEDGRRVQVEQPGLSRIDALATAMIETMDILRKDQAA